MKALAAVGVLASVIVAGCSALPTAGPTASDVKGQEVKDNLARFDLVSIDDNVVTTLLALPAESFHVRFKKYGRPPQPKIGIGDSVVVSIWEAAGGGLFGASPTDHVSAGSRSVTIPEQIVARDGGISVPFADRVPAAGRLPVEVQKTIEQRLAEKAIEPQVIVTVTKSISNSATVTGEVISGARVPLSLKGDRLLDLIAAAGGARAPVYETFVRLSRDGITATIPMEALVSDPGREYLCLSGRRADPGAAAAILYRVRRDRNQYAGEFHRRADDAGRSAGQGGGVAKPALRPSRGVSIPVRAARPCQRSRPAATANRPRRILTGRLSARFERRQILLPGAALCDARQGHHLRSQCRFQRAAKVLHHAEYADRTDLYRHRGEKFG